MTTKTPMPTRETVPSLFTDDKSKVRPMSEQESHGFINLTFAEMHLKEKGQLDAFDAEGLLAQIELVSGKPPSFGEQVFVRRVGGFAPDVKMHDLTVLWLVALCNNPAEVVMYAYSLVHASRKLGKAITLGDWSELSPWGPATEEYLHTVWDAQKHPDCPAGNWLDTPEAFQ